MSQLYINILRTPAKNTFRRYLGLMYIILGILWLIIRILNKEPAPSRFPLPFFDVIYIVFFGISGIIFTIEGSGISISRWFGEAFIKIDTTGISVKKSVFAKEWILMWNEVEQVEFSVIKINFLLSGNVHRELNYDNLDYEHIQEIKKSIYSISEEKRIGVISPV